VSLFLKTEILNLNNLPSNHLTQLKGAGMLHEFKKNLLRIIFLTITSIALLPTTQAHALLLTDPNDARNWQGATVGTFAALYYGSDTLANRQLVINNNLLDDGVFDPSNYLVATLISNANGGGCLGTSFDLTGTGSLGYGCGGGSISTYANGIDNLWFQTDGVVGQTVFDLGFNATKAAIFNSIDHGPLPQEAIESTVYLSNDQLVWTQAVVERVWLEGFQSNLGIKWDGFTYAVGTGTNNTFRYASVTHGGPGSLIQDGDNEINGIMGLQSDFRGDDGSGNVVPEPASALLFSLGGIGAILNRRKKS
jgi:hypothetical protein